jgi:glycerate kinase
VADGGDGTLDVLLAAAGPSARVTRHQVTGPLGRSVPARLGWTDARSAVIELADAAGLRLLSPTRLDALHATSRGVGELLAIALAAGATHVTVGVGGSACTDGGAGMLQALGAHLGDAAGEELGPGGGALGALASIDMSGIDPRLRNCRIEVATDVRNPLHGPSGAAAVFAVQKGATAEAVALLDAALAHLAEIATRDLGATGLAGLPGAGAAGGCGFGLALLGAALLAGAALVCDAVGLDRALSGATLALTGEGQLDRQTADGKAPAEVALRARRHGVPCIAVAGRVLDPLPDLFDAAIALDRLAGDADPRRHARSLLRHAARIAVLG